MTELGSSYTGPPKYLAQRDSPLEIPLEVVRKLFLAMDVDMDDKISMTELKDYIRRFELAIDESTIGQMYHEAASHRAVTHEHQRTAPLAIEEIFAAVKGRFSYNRELQAWGVGYRPYRDYWILILLTCNERLFALQVPKAIPGKIQAQYEEQEAIVAVQQSLQRGEITFAKAEGIDRRYLSVAEQRAKAFARNPDKTEANIAPEACGTVVFEAEAKGTDQLGAFESQVNKKVGKDAGANPKFTFESKELYG